MTKSKRCGGHMLSPNGAYGRYMPSSSSTNLNLNGATIYYANSLCFSDYVCEPMSHLTAITSASESEHLASKITHPSSTNTKHTSEAMIHHNEREKKMSTTQANRTPHTRASRKAPIHMEPPLACQSHTKPTAGFQHTNYLGDLNMHWRVEHSEHHCALPACRHVCRGIMLHGRCAHAAGGCASLQQPP